MATGHSDHPNATLASGKSGDLATYWEVGWEQGLFAFSMKASTRARFTSGFASLRISASGAEAPNPTTTACASPARSHELRLFNLDWEGQGWLSAVGCFYGLKACVLARVWDKLRVRSKVSLGEPASTSESLPYFFNPCARTLNPLKIFVNCLGNLWLHSTRSFWHGTYRTIGCYLVSLTQFRFSWSTSSSFEVVSIWSFYSQSEWKDKDHGRQLDAGITGTDARNRLSIA